MKYYHQVFYIFIIDLIISLTNHISLVTISYQKDLLNKNNIFIFGSNINQVKFQRPPYVNDHHICSTSILYTLSFINACAYSDTIQINDIEFSMVNQYYFDRLINKENYLLNQFILYDLLKFNNNIISIQSNFCLNSISIPLYLNKTNQIYLNIPFNNMVLENKINFTYIDSLKCSILNQKFIIDIDCILKLFTIFKSFKNDLYYYCFKNSKQNQINNLSPSLKSLDFKVLTNSIKIINELYFLEFISNMKNISKDQQIINNYFLGESFFKILNQ